MKNDGDVQHLTGHEGLVACFSLAGNMNGWMDLGYETELELEDE